MMLQLHDLRVRFTSQSPLLDAQWQHLFQGWLTEEPNPHVQFELNLVDDLPVKPAGNPIFTDHHARPDSMGILSVYADSGETVLLHFLDGALIKLSLYAGEPRYPIIISGWMEEKALENGRFEDIVYTSLAPILRRHGYYLLHSFAAAKNDQAIIIVGPSGSGKTTTGLSLLFHGWKLLTNDILLMQLRDDKVMGLATPGTVSIRDFTFELLPKLKPLRPPKSLHGGKTHVSGEQITKGNWASPTPIRALLFPSIEERPLSIHTPLHKAVGLAKLMEESVDRWDSAFVNEHMAVLQTLTKQTAVYNLHLGQDMEDVPALIEQCLQPDRRK